MKTIILYATKYGAAREIAQRIAGRLKDAVIHDLKQKDLPSLAEFDCVVIGSSLYVGSIRKEAKAFLSKHTDNLRNKRIGLFLAGFETNKEQEYFENNFTPELVRAAKARCFPGGVHDPSKAGAFDKFILKAVGRPTGYSNTIDDKIIEQFVEELQRS